MKNDNLTKYLVISLIMVVIIWGGITTVFHFIFGNTFELSGQIGDAFGSVNALFSAFAFAFLIYTALMQKKELELQREELKLTRAELKRTAESQEKLAKINLESLEFQKIQYEQVNGSQYELTQLKPTSDNKVEIYLKVANFDLYYLGYHLFNEIRNRKKIEVRVMGEPNSFTTREKGSEIRYILEADESFAQWRSTLSLIFKNSRGMKMYQDFKMINGQIDLSRPIENNGTHLTPPEV